MHQNIRSIKNKINVIPVLLANNEKEENKSVDISCFSEQHIRSTEIGLINLFLYLIFADLQNRNDYTTKVLKFSDIEV